MAGDIFADSFDNVSHVYSSGTTFEQHAIRNINLKIERRIYRTYWSYWFR